MCIRRRGHDDNQHESTSPKQPTTAEQRAGWQKNEWSAETLIWQRDRLIADLEAAQAERDGWQDVATRSQDETATASVRFHQAERERGAAQKRLGEAEGLLREAHEHLKSAWEAAEELYHPVHHTIDAFLAGDTAHEGEPK